MSSTRSIARLFAPVLCLTLSYATKAQAESVKSATPQPTEQEARAFLKKANDELGAIWSFRERTAFVNQTYITDDTTLLSSLAEEKAMEVEGRITREAKRFANVALPADLKRQIKLLLQSSTLPAPDDAKLRSELANISTDLTSMYGKGEACLPGTPKKCIKLDEAERILAKERNYDKLKDVWAAWHQVGAGMRQKYAREVEIANAGAKDIAFKDLSELWKSGYDMSPEAFEQETDRLWSDVKPLYEQLHCYARGKLSAKYGKDKVPNEGTVPAHVFGNMWAQEWGNLSDLLMPYPGEKALDVTKALQGQKYDVLKMVKTAEGFFTSLGLDPLPPTYWTRSMLTRPKDREVVCHASAWDVSGDGDLRMKACFEVKGDDFETAHHELGHNYYYMYYKTLPTIFKTGANDGFHEGIGDTLILSMNPSYFKKIGLSTDDKSNEKRVINQQMARAVNEVAFLPFGLLIDRWRWEVFSGRTPEAKYNTRWWELRKQYQGMHPPLARTEADFDPGAKYHVPNNTPYTRYFLARILQFQFHRGLCKAAGITGPLHECSIYGNKVAGEKLKAMLAMGASKPWPEALAVATGETKLDSSAMIEYFQPLMTYLKKQNEGQHCGW